MHRRSPGARALRAGTATALLAVLGLALHGCTSAFARQDDPAYLPQSTLDEAREIDQAQQLVDDGLYDQARAKLSILFAHGCRHPQALMLEGSLAFQQGDFEQAIPWCEKAIQASPLWFEPRVLLAQSYLKLKKYNNAISCFEDIDRIAPDLPWGPYGVGTIAALRGDTKTAVKEFDIALQRDPRHPQSLEGRADLARLMADRVTEQAMLQRYVAEEPLDAEAFERLGELAVMDARNEDARRAFEHAYALDPLPDAAKQLMELARQRGDLEEERKWAELAGVPVKAVNHIDKSAH